MTTGDAQEAARRLAERLTEGVYDVPALETRAEFLEALTVALEYELVARERAGLEKAASSVEGAPKGCTDFYATFVTRKEAASAIRALMVEPSEKETGR